MEKESYKPYNHIQESYQKISNKKEKYILSQNEYINELKDQKFIFENNFNEIKKKNEKVDDFWAESMKKALPKKSKVKLHAYEPIPVPSMPKFQPKIEQEQPKPIQSKEQTEEKIEIQPTNSNLQELYLQHQAKIALDKSNQQQWNVNAGFMESDTFSDDPNKMTAAQRRKARVITRIAQGEKLGSGLFKKGFEDEKSVAQAINMALFHLPVEITALEDYPYLKKQLQEQVSKFIVHKFEGSGIGIGYLHINEIRQQVEVAVKQGVASYLKAFEVDIPLYQKLFEEMDELRVNGRDPLEVYLGRDGIYAYIARRAQDIGERRAMSWQERKALKQKGEIGRGIKYLVYPRAFRDGVREGAKYEYLFVNGVMPENDPVFYDTGYVGSIPEQIMQILGYTSEEMDARMKLLSATKAERKVKAIEDHKRATIVEQIEHNAKPEEVAVGLYKDPVTGKIKPVAQASNPEEQFMFAMVRAAISNFYYTKAREASAVAEVAA